MSAFRRTSLFLMLLHLTAVSAQRLSFIVSDGDEVSLPCHNATQDRDHCNGTVWTFTESFVAEDSVVFPSERRSVTANCSLVIKKVTDDDAGVYVCQTRDKEETEIYLSVVSMTECKNSEWVTLLCFVSGKREHEVAWEYVDGAEHINTSETVNSAVASFPTSHDIYTSKNYEQMRCNVTDRLDGAEHRFTLSPQSSVTRTTTVHEDFSTLGSIMLVMHVAELLLMTAITVLLIRTRGNQRSRDGDAVFNPAGSPAAAGSGPGAARVKIRQ